MENKYDFLKILIPIFIPLTLYVIKYIQEAKTKKHERAQILKSQLDILFQLLTTLEQEATNYSGYLLEVSTKIISDFSQRKWIKVDSKLRGVTHRLTLLDFREINESLVNFLKLSDSSSFFRKVYHEIDFQEDFQKNLLIAINNYQKEVTEKRTLFRSGLVDYMNFQARLITKLKEEGTNLEFVSYIQDLTNSYLDVQKNDPLFHYSEYLQPIFQFVVKHNRTDYFANELLERIKHEKILIDDLYDNAQIFKNYFTEASIDIKESSLCLKAILLQLKENGINQN